MRREELMNELIKITYNNDRPAVSARDLHDFLEVGARYNDWFPRMCEYGFEEFKDFWTKMSESTGGRPSTEYDLSIDMAKQICMIQRSPEGKQIRQYFIDLEKAWNRRKRNGIRINHISLFSGGNATDLPPTETYRIGAYKTLKTELLKNT